MQYYNQIIKRIVNLIDRNNDSTLLPSLLLVFGDHGMTESGDHGGATYVRFSNICLTQKLFVNALQ